MTKSEYPQHAPRLLNKKDAAAYCGVSVPTFDSAEPPAPVRLAGRVLRWDVRKLDAWIDGKCGGGPRSSIMASIAKLGGDEDDEIERALAALGGKKSLEPPKRRGRRQP